MKSRNQNELRVLDLHGAVLGRTHCGRVATNECADTWQLPCVRMSGN